MVFCACIRDKRWKIWSVGLAVSLAVGVIPLAGELLTVLGIVLLTSFKYGRDAKAPTTSNPESVEDVDVNHQDDKDDNNKHAKETEREDRLEEQPTAEVPRQSRLFFLDNLKVFLTVVVVVHHVTCAFGGCGEKSWFLNVGYGKATWFLSFADGFTTINQAYFMPLFFFVSAYFTPSSLERKTTTQFFRDRSRRLWIPAMAGTFIIIPSVILGGHLVAGRKPPITFPHPAHCWFLFWLLLMNWCYHDVSSELGAERSPFAFPSTPKRMLVGWLICGLLQLIVVAMLLNNGSLGGMPNAQGSLVCDLLMFATGIIAKKSRWLEQPLRQQMDISIGWVRCFVVAEMTGMVFLFPHVDTTPIGIAYSLGAFSVAGIYCLDMSLVMVDFFQTNVNLELPRFFSSSAYSVYILHPLPVVLCTAIFVWVYNGIYSEPQLDFEPKALLAISKTPLGAGTLAVGWASVSIASLLLVWPLGWIAHRTFPGVL